MHPAVALLGLSVMGALTASVSRWCVVSIALAITMGALWAAANLAWLTGRSDLIPLVDLPVALAAYAVWREGGKPWQGVLAGIMAARLALHLAHPAMGSPEEAAFFHVLNATFLAAVAAIAWEGGIKDAVGTCSRLWGVSWVRLRLPALASVAGKAP